MRVAIVGGTGAFGRAILHRLRAAGDAVVIGSRDAGRAHELMMTARRFDAEEALRIGLLADAVPGDQLQARVDRAVDDLLEMPPLSLSLTKQGMWLALEIPSFDAAVEMENRQQVLTSATADQEEAMAAFRETRPPVYRNQ